MQRKIRFIKKIFKVPNKNSETLCESGLTTLSYKQRLERKFRRWIYRRNFRKKKELENKKGKKKENSDNNEKNNCAKDYSKEKKLIKIKI